MAPAGGSQSLRQFKVAHLKRKADEELKRGNYGHAADRYSQAIAVLVPPATAASQPLPSLPAGPQHASTPDAWPATSLELLCPSTSLHTAAADPEAPWSNSRSASDAANHSQQLAAPRVPAGDVAELRALLSNRSLALLKAGQAAAAVEDASCVIALAPCWPKGHWRMAKALCELKRWSDALDCFARAWSLSEPGSPEQGECEQQLLAVVQRLTRQGLADRLLAILQSHYWTTQQAQQHQPPMLPAQPAPADPSPPQLQQGALAAPAAAGTVSDGTQIPHAAVAEPAVRAVDSTAAAVAELFQACHGEELREGMFRLVKAAQQQQPPARCASQTVNKMQAVLVKWLVLQVDDYSSNSTSISSANQDSHSRSRGSRHVLSSALPAVLDLQLQLLTAQLAVKVKRWGVAQVVAADLQHKLAKLVLQDEGVLLQLLVDCHIVLGEALWAAGPGTDCTHSSSSRGGSSAGSSSSTALAARRTTAGDVAVCCQPYKAAAACLTALDLLPVTPSATGSNSGSSTAASETSRGSGAATKPSFVQLLLRAGQRLGGDAAVASAAAEQLRKDVQGRLDAALEQLNDLEQAAVWARAAAAGRHGTSPQFEQESAAITACATKAPAARDAAAAAAEMGPVVVPCTGSSTTSSSSSSSSPVKTGWELACIQLGLRGASSRAATQIAGDQQSLLVTVRIEALTHSSELDNSCSTDSRANSGSGTCADMANSSSTSSSSSSSNGSSVHARGLSGAARVAVLRGIARAAGVGSLSVGLGQIQLAPTAADMGQAGTGKRSAGTGLAPCAEGGKGSVHSLTIKVQFGADAAAAARFVELCQSLASLVAACPELAAALVDSTFSAPAADAVQLKPEQDYYTSSTVCAGSSSSRSDAAAAAASCGSGSRAGATAAAGCAALGVEAAAVPLYHIAAVDVADLLRVAAANTRTTATPNQDNLLLLKQPQQQQATATAVSERQHGPGAVDQDKPDSSESSMQAQLECLGATTVTVEAPALSVASRDVVATNSSSAELSVVEHDGVPDAAAAVIPLPYAHYRLVGEDGRMLERPDKHPFALSRVLYDARELPSSDCEVWYEAADGAYRWRQTSSTVFLQLHALPDSITTAKELTVTIAAFSLRVLEQCSGELLFEAELARGIVPEGSTWVFVKPERRARGSSSSSSRDRGTAGVAATGSRSSGLSAGALMLTSTAAVGLTSSTAVNGQHILFELSKMNLELYERPHQHSASWWPRLFADDAADIAWDDAPKDYSDLPPAIAAAAAAEAAREDELRREQQERQEARNKTQELVDRHKQYRAERLRELKAAAWNAAARSSSSSSSSTECSAGTSSTSSNTSSGGSVLAAELSV